MGGMEQLPCEWGRLTLSDVSWLGMLLRRVSWQHTSLAARASAITQLLFDAFLCAEDGGPLCPLVQVFRTVSVTGLSEEERAYVAQRTAASGEELPDRVLQLIGTSGLRAEWCDPALSSTSRCVSINAGTFPVQYPLLSALLTSPSVDIPVSDGPWVTDESMTEYGRAAGLHLLYVADAKNSPTLPLYAEGVAREDIQSVLGCSGRFQDGEQFVVVLLSRKVIPPSVLPLLRMLALNIRLGLGRQGLVSGRHDWRGENSASPRASGVGDADIFEELLGLYEGMVMRQEVRLDDELARVVAQQGVIADHAARVHALNRQLLVAAEEERRVLARDLHDVVATQLGGMIFQMQAVLDVPEEGRDALQWIGQYRHDLLEIVDRTRQLSFDLHPASLERAGVIGALERVLQEAGRRQGWIVDSHCSESVERVLTYEESVCVYRVAQEALHNCEKHAQATRVGIRLEVCGDDLLLRVTDNGRGFEPSVRGGVVRERGLGHVGMEERARLINAELRIESSLTTGTSVSLHMKQGGRWHHEGLVGG